jgi:hypothetical protein
MSQYGGKNDGDDRRQQKQPENPPGKSAAKKLPA